MLNRRKRRIVTTIVIVVVILLLLQLQPFVVKARQGVDGAFGYHPITDDCIGWVGPADSISWLPFGHLEFRLGVFDFNYLLLREDFDESVQMCMGQDIRHGE